MDFAGKVVIITGGSRGLGFLMAQEFGKRGAKVAICGRTLSALEEAEGKLRQRGIDVLTRVADLGDKEQAASFVEQVIMTWGRIDVLVNDAGVIQVGPLASITHESLEEVMRSNFWSAANMTLSALPHLRVRAPMARIVNIVSFGGRVAVPHLLSYSASKFALMGLSEGLRAELSREGIPVTSVIPIPMRTGSIYNASFSGNTREEFAWFGLSASLPLISASAERAARQVVRAAADGDAEVYVGLPTRALSILHGVAPQLVMGLMGLLNRALPSAAGTAGKSVRGRDVHSELERSPALHLSNVAARQNNEAPPADAR